MVSNIFLVFCLFLSCVTLICGKYFTVDNHQYYLSHPVKKNWFEALRYCTFHCLVLVDITDENENNRILSIIKGSDFINDPDSRYWTGGTALGTNRQFYWASTAQSVFYTDFGDGQPDNKDGREKCLEIVGEYGFKWNDNDCNDSRYFICRNPAFELEKPVRVANASRGYTYV